MEAASQINPQGPSANAEGPKEAKRAEFSFDPEKEWNELHKDMESEEDPGAGMGMDEEEETLPRESDAGDDAGGESSFGYLINALKHVLNQQR